VDQFDSIIIGSGQAAPALAVALGKRGERVALIEGARLGGTCVNSGCTPTKTLRKSARVAHIARRAGDFGVITGPVEVDFGAAMARMRDRVDTARRGLTAWLKRSKTVELIHGWARFEGFDENGRFIVGVGDGKVLADKVYLNIGTRAFVPDVPGIDDVPVLDNAGLLNLTELPDHLIIVGGSYIGLEMGQIFRRLGSKVTILHRAERLAEREDADVSAIIAEFFEDEGVELVLNADIESLGSSMRGVLVTLKNGREIGGSHVLFATGRLPNTDKLNLDAIGLETDAGGYIRTDAGLRTELPNFWALGDVNRRGAFTHTSYHDHEIVLAARDGTDDLHQWRDADQRPTTYAMFTDPPLGRVGLSRSEALELVREGRNILISDMKMADISRAKEESETTGLIRIIVDGDSEAILGATVFGISGDEIIAVFSNFMATGASYRIMQQALPVHPTVAELLPTILNGLSPLEASDD
jgi:pyruvate/2-oxoglutarate dehydrogenase complex dihydrolipoamide dehydrogenase (E3) component